MSQRTDEIRLEQDSMGEVKVPAWAYWGAQTQRANDNFPISGYRIPRPMIRGLALLKLHGARVNASLGLIDQDLADKIVEAAEEVVEGKLDEHFPLDIFQTGSGTSTNMNMNEVLSNRANELLGHPRGGRHPVHPNDHVNRGQSSNDTIPASIHIAIREQLSAILLPALQGLATSLRNKADEFKDVVKIGRTHLMDAVPVTLGQEFGAYATQVEKGIARVEATFPHIEELALGGTAVGTGLNSPAQFAPQVIAQIAERTGIPFRQADDLFEALAARDAIVEVSGALNTLSVSLMKIANDLRVLNSGPRTALGEIQLPSLQPGSSIMPGKVNPVIPEVVNQVAFQIIGLDTTVSLASEAGQLELNVFEPIIAFNLFTSIRMLLRAMPTLRLRCIDGITANKQRCLDLVKNSIGIVTALNPLLGYEKTSNVAKEALKTGRSVYDLVLEKGLLDQETLDRLLSPASMLQPTLHKGEL